MSEILVKKRNGKSEPFSADKTNKVIKWACEGVQGVVENEIAGAFHTNIRNGISTKEIHKGLIDAAVGLINETNPNYEIAAANLLNYELRKRVWKGKDAPDFYSFIVENTKNKRYTDEILQWYSKEEIDDFGKYIKHDRDFNFKYSGLSQVIDKYLIKTLPDKKVYETPQIAYMLIAMVLFHDEKGYVKEIYDSISNFDISLPTPIFAGVRTNLKSFASCLLLDMGDSVDEICTGFEVIAKATSKRFGIGVNMTKMRPIGAPIRGGENIHTGKIGFLRTIQDTIKTWLQSSTRSGAATVTVPIWDYEIEEILQLKDPMRLPENRVGDIDYLISISKLFYNRWARNETITLFNAHEVPELEKAFGLPEFDELYLKAEANTKLKFRKVVNMREIGDLFQKNGIESGRYYLLNIDHANSHGSFTDKIGMANLCVAPETLILTKDGYEAISDLEGLNVEIWNGREWSVSKCEKTGENQKLIELTFESDKLDFDDVQSAWVTEYHKFYLHDGTEVRAKDLKVNDILEKFYAHEPAYNGDNKERIYRVAFISEEDRFSDTYCVNEPIRHRAIFNGVEMGNCVEVTHPTFPMQSLNDPDGLLGICILLASNAVNLKSDEKHQRVCELSVRILDKLIDYQDYFCLPAENFATKFRSLGIGMTNFAALLAKKGLQYSSQEAREYANQLFEKNLFYLIQASVRLAKEKGPCEWLSRTKYGKGILPIDNYAKSVDTIVNPKLLMDWETLREDLIKYGIRNATLVAKMPCEASSLVTNSTNGIERPRSKFVSKGNKSKDLPTIVPNFKKWAYEYAFDNPSNEDHIKMMAIVQKYCDMSISTNFYYNYNHYEDGQIPLKVLNKDIFDAYRYGLKTIYYRNSEDGNNHNLSDSKQESCSGGACSV